MLSAALVWYLVVIAVTAVLVFAFYRFARGAYRRPRTRKTAA
jgi:hypothetical protein